MDEARHRLFKVPPIYLRQQIWNKTKGLLSLPVEALESIFAQLEILGLKALASTYRHLRDLTHDHISHSHGLRYPLDIRYPLFPNPHVARNPTDWKVSKDAIDLSRKAHGILSKPALAEKVHTLVFEVEGYQVGTWSDTYLPELDLKDLKPLLAIIPNATRVKDFKIDLLRGDIFGPLLKNMDRLMDLRVPWNSWSGAVNGLKIKNLVYTAVYRTWEDRMFFNETLTDLPSLETFQCIFTHGYPSSWQNRCIMDLSIVPLKELTLDGRFMSLPENAFIGKSRYLTRFSSRISTNIDHIFFSLGSNLRRLSLYQMQGEIPGITFRHVETLEIHFCTHNPSSRASFPSLKRFSYSSARGSNPESVRETEPLDPPFEIIEKRLSHLRTIFIRVEDWTMPKVPTRLVDQFLRAKSTGKLKFILLDGYTVDADDIWTKTVLDNKKYCCCIQEDNADNRWHIRKAFLCRVDLKHKFDETLLIYDRPTDSRGLKQRGKELSLCP